LRPTRQVQLGQITREIVRDDMRMDVYAALAIGHRLRSPGRFGAVSCSIHSIEFLPGQRFL
jgi:hypothetical protein